jgi:hypothetical protein
MTDPSTWHIPTLTDVLAPGTYDLRIHVAGEGAILTTARVVLPVARTVAQLDATLSHTYSDRPVSVIWVHPVPDADTVELTRDEYTQMMMLARIGANSGPNTNGISPSQLWVRKHTNNLDAIDRRIG